MNPLSIEAINQRSPYVVWQDGDLISFTTAYGVDYSVSFDPDDNPHFPAYWFNLINRNQTKSPGDKKIPQTIICIMEEFFRQNPDILLYMCSTAGDQQAQRARLFLRWFNGYEQQRRYFIKATPVRGEGLMEYVALIVQRSHPQLEAIISLFDAEIQMFNENK